MKYIKFFESYPDNELEDLQNSLSDIGHDYKFTLGVDFGFGDLFSEKLSTERGVSKNGYSFDDLLISKELFNKLIKEGILETVKYFNSIDDKGTFYEVSDKIKNQTGVDFWVPESIEDSEKFLRIMGIGGDENKVVEFLGNIKK
jgi:hypothetical protein